MRRLLLSTTIILLFHFSLHAQQNCDSLLRYYGKDHRTSRMFPTGKGGQVFAGRRDVTDGSGAAYVLKTNECGKNLWEKYYAPNPNYRSWYARAFDESTAGDVFALINADSLVGTTRNQMRLYKINAQGDQEWASTYQSNSFDIVPYGVCATADGGALCGGWKGFWAVYPNAALLVKFNASGGVEWTKTYGSGLISSIKQVEDGYVFIRYYWKESSRLRSFLYKINNAGEVQWFVETPPDYKNKFTDQYSDWAVQVMPKADNSAYTVVRTQGAGFFPDTIFLSKFSNTGGLLWNKKYAYQSYQEIHSIQNTSDGGYLLCGYYSHPVNDTTGIYLMRLNSDGDTIWTSKVTKTKFNTSDYPLVFTAGTDAYETGDNKYDVGGTLQFNTQQGSNVTVSFSSLLIKFARPSVHSIAGTKLNVPGILKISPNPALSWCVVELPELKGLRARIEVSDAYGRILQSTPITSDQKTIRLDLHTFNPGIYNVNVLADGVKFAAAKLMVQ